MAKEVTYRCDLCKEVKPKEAIYLYYYDCGVLPQRYVVKHINTENQNSCDKHICKLCIERVTDFGRQMN